MIAAVNFGNFNSWADFSLIRTSKTISPPEPKGYTVEVEGSDGELDLTEYFGETKFKNRKLTFNFSTVVPRTQAQFLAQYSDIQNKLHGQKMKISLEEEPEFYYFGRIKVKSWKISKGVGDIVIECNVGPYKYKQAKTLFSFTVSETSEQYVLPNLRKQAVPTFKITAPTTIVFGGSTYVIGAAGMTGEQSYIIPEIALSGGNNIISMSGNGTVKIEYQEGGL